jgi:hypothetical protein
MGSAFEVGMLGYSSEGAGSQALGVSVGDGLIFFGFRLLRKYEDSDKPINFTVAHDADELGCDLGSTRQ